MIVFFLVMSMVFCEYAILYLAFFQFSYFIDFFFTPHTNIAYSPLKSCAVFFLQSWTFFSITDSATVKIFVAIAFYLLIYLINSLG